MPLTKKSLLGFTITFLLLSMLLISNLLQILGLYTVEDTFYKKNCFTTGLIQALKSLTCHEAEKGKKNFRMTLMVLLLFFVELKAGNVKGVSNFEVICIFERESGLKIETKSTVRVSNAVCKHQIELY